MVPEKVIMSFECDSQNLDDYDMRHYSGVADEICAICPSMPASYGASETQPLSKLDDRDNLGFMTSLDQIRAKYSLQASDEKFKALALRPKTLDAIDRNISGTHVFV